MQRRDRQKGFHYCLLRIRTSQAEDLWSTQYAAAETDGLVPAITDACDSTVVYFFKKEMWVKGYKTVCQRSDKVVRGSRDIQK